MTYKELYESAADKLEKSKITLGEFEKMIEPLNAEIDTDSDTISRQVAISAICSACGKIDCDKMDKCEKLQLPPANNSEIPNSSDMISRQAAIDIVEFECGEWSGLAKTIAEEIKQLPPAQPKRGRWIYKNDLMTVPTGYWECSECKEGRLLYEENFCPHCGAQMEVAT